MNVGNCILGKRIEEAMKVRGFNKNSLSKSIGIHPSTLNNWITGSTRPLPFLQVAYNKQVISHFCIKGPKKGPNITFSNIRR